MSEPKLQSTVNEIKGVGPKATSILKFNNINTVEDLLLYYPYRFDNYSKKVRINNLVLGESCHIKIKITSIKSGWANRRRMTIVNAIGQDDSGSLPIVWFNNRYISRYIKKDKQYILLGKAASGKNGLYFSNPVIFDCEKKQKIKYIVPIYSEISGLNSKWFLSKISQILNLCQSIKDPLPVQIQKKQKLIPLSQAIKYVHAPENEANLQAAVKRLGFDEIFYLQLRSIYQKHQRLHEKAVSVKKDIGFIKKQLANISFTLTNYQKKALWDIMNDIEQSHPMNRLLEGDVGSGKTIVAALAMSLMAKNKYLSFLIAPTEILAFQHFQKLPIYLKRNKITIALLTGTQSKIYYLNKIEHTDKTTILQKLKQKKIDILVATHSILHAKQEFDNLGLVVVDEQHRFGVKQRNTYYATKSKVTPHHLSMSATPIPRSLALTIYGHLSLSQLKTLPSGRKPIKTSIINPDQRESCYQYIRQQIQAGRQAYIICPLVEESDKIQVKSATEEYDRLKQYVFAELKLGLIHGQMKGFQKDKIFSQFQANKINILVSTSIIEVGIDIPNANIIVIEGAERFGLSQLHQLRGRVGRGQYQSYCFLFTENSSVKSTKRLQTLCSTNDGFQIAEADLNLRGPGEITGLKQSGLPELKMASFSDHSLIKDSYEMAENLIKKDKVLKNFPMLRKKIISGEMNLS